MATSPRDCRNSVLYGSICNVAPSRVCRNFYVCNSIHSEVCGYHDPQFLELRRVQFNLRVWLFKLACTTVSTSALQSKFCGCPGSRLPQHQIIPFYQKGVAMVTQHSSMYFNLKCELTSRLCGNHCAGLTCFDMQLMTTLVLAHHTSS